MNIEIRNYEKDQINEICTIHNKAFSEWIDSLGILYGYKAITRSDVTKWIELDSNHILIAYENQVPCGYLHYKIRKCKGQEKELTFLEIVETCEGRGQSKIAIIPEKRRNGIANTLLKHVLNISKEQNVDVVLGYAYNHNLHIHNILSKFGFFHRPKFYYRLFSSRKPIIHDSVLAEFDFSTEIRNNKDLIHNEIQIRAFQSNDLEDIHQIFMECRPDMVEIAKDNDVGKYWLKQNWAKKTLVAELQGEVIGCMEYNDVGVIGIPGVKKQHQRKGIGYTLLYHLLQDMKLNNFTKALADTGILFPHAIKLYRRLNFDLSRELWGWVKIL